MKIAIASGKGGTGKTLVATNLAHIAAKKITVNLYDLDVEEPNSHLFINTTPISTEDVKMMIPVVDKKKCNHCGIYSKVCEYHVPQNLNPHPLLYKYSPACEGSLPFHCQPAIPLRQHHLHALCNSRSPDPVAWLLFRGQHHPRIRICCHLPAGK